MSSRAAHVDGGIFYERQENKPFLALLNFKAHLCADACTTFVLLQAIGSRNFSEFTAGISKLADQIPQFWTTMHQRPILNLFTVSCVDIRPDVHMFLGQCELENFEPCFIHSPSSALCEVQ